MTLFVRMRTQSVAGGIADPHVVVDDGDGGVVIPALDEGLVARLVKDRHVLLVSHGFNVPQDHGVRSLRSLESALHISQGREIFFGILWPGDWWLPVVNYPWEAADAVNCGKRLAKFCDRVMQGAASLSFASHSLGGRLILETVKNLNRKANSIALTAAAVDRDCLSGQYASAQKIAGVISNLASRNDHVLKLAYPAGDFLSDIFYDDDDPFQIALGLKGPKPLPSNCSPAQIDANPANLIYDHGSYFPPGDVVVPPAGTWQAVANYLGNAFRGLSQSWP